MGSGAYGPEVGPALRQRLDALLADSDWVLGHFTLAADLTVLRPACRLAASPDAVVARYDELPFAALAFLAPDAAQLTRLAARLVAPEESFYLLLNEEDARLAEQAFLVEDVHPEYQMLFGADPERLEPGRPVRLGPHDLAAMRRLGAEVELTAMEKSPLQHGPAFGIWDGGELVAMGATHLLVPGAAEIGNIATHPAHRRRGLARQVVAALVRAHRAQGRRVFLMVFQDNPAGVRLYTGLGFAPLRPMFLTRCRLSSASR